MHVLLEMAKCARTNKMDSNLITRKLLIMGQSTQISRNCSMMNTTKHHLLTQFNQKYYKAIETL